MSVRTEERLIKTYDATDPRGYPHTIEVWQVVDIASTLDGSESETAGPKDYRTTAGVQLNYLSKGKYQVVATGELLTSSEPDAD